MNPTFKIHITGIQKDFSEESSRQLLALLFNVPEDKLAPIFKTPLYTVKRGLDEKSVAKYEIALKECGCLCQIEEELKDVQKSFSEDTNIENKIKMIFCHNCGNKIPSSISNCPHCGAVQEISHRYTNPEDPIPQGVKGWSWGAFWLNWIWAIGNKTWIGLIALIPVVGLIMSIILGFKGREWAWKNNQWNDLEHFNSVQKKWSFWGWVFFGVSFFVVLMVTIILIGIPRYEEYKNSQSNSDETPVLILTPPQPTLNSDKPKNEIEKKITIGVIQEFVCGDYCYLTILSKDDNNTITFMGDGGAADSDGEVKKEFQNVELRILWHTEKIYIPEGQIFQMVNIIDNLEKVK